MEPSVYPSHLSPRLSRPQVTTFLILKCWQLSITVLLCTLHDLLYHSTLLVRCSHVNTGRYRSFSLLYGIILLCESTVYLSLLLTMKAAAALHVLHWRVPLWTSLCTSPGGHVCGHFWGLAGSEGVCSFHPPGMLPSCPIPCVFKRLMCTEHLLCQALKRQQSWKSHLL